MMEIIAELAQGFEGRPELARLLLKAAASAGADAAKYQLVFADELAAPDYQHYDLFKSLEMPDRVWGELAAYAAELGIGLQVDIFGPRSLALAEHIGAAAIKLHGTDIANAGLLSRVAGSGVRRVLLGAGGSHVDELDAAVQPLAAKQVCVLLGFQGYPTPDDTNQISRVGFLAAHFNAGGRRVSMGFADHAAPESPLRYGLAAAAIGAGATVIEKHLTLGRGMKLEDHESALNPDEFAEFVQVVRGCAGALGHTTADRDFGMSESERGYRVKIRRHVVAARALSAGASLQPSDLVLKRTSGEGALTNLSRAYGRTLVRDVPMDAPIFQTDVQ